MLWREPLHTESNIDAVRLLSNTAEFLTMCFAKLEIAEWVLFCVGTRRGAFFTHLGLVSRGVNGRRVCEGGERRNADKKVSIEKWPQI